jgi:hypothetical protein
MGELGSETRPFSTACRRGTFSPYGSVGPFPTACGRDTPSPYGSVAGRGAASGAPSAGSVRAREGIDSKVETGPLGVVAAPTAPETVVPAAVGLSMPAVCAQAGAPGVATRIDAITMAATARSGNREIMGQLFPGTKS